MIRPRFERGDAAVYAIDGADWLFHAPTVTFERFAGAALDASGEPVDAVAARFAELDRIAAGGRSARAAIARRNDGRAPAVSALNLNLTPRCALDCAYCYAKGGDYARIRDDMRGETVAAALASAAGRVDATRPFRFEFFGGEPLLNPAAIAATLDLEGSAALPPGPVVHRVSTSLTRADGRILDLLARGRMIVSVSLDGGPETQNLQRPYKGGGGTYDDIVASVARVRERLPDATLVARMTAWRGADRLLPEIRALRDLNLFDYCSVYPAALTEERDGRVHMSPPFRDAYLAFAGAYDELVGRPGNRFKGCLELNRFLGHLLDGTAAANHCRAGDGYYTLSPDGTVHPCHRLVGETAHAVPGGLAGIDAVPAFWRIPVDARPVCGACAIRYFCGGGCKQENLISTGDPLAPSPGGCAFARLVFEAALLAFARIGPDARAAVAASSADLARLFVFCGQDAVPL